jgi:23S rRNA (guanine745-N1)-methyltransferase
MSQKAVNPMAMQAPLDQVLRFLCCPHCRGAFHRRAGTILCDHGHAFDVARQGYVNLLGTTAPANADDAEMVGARARFLGAGFFAPLAEAVTRLAAHATKEASVRDTCILDVGAGHGFYLSHVLDVCEEYTGIALDVSRFAARRAARCHARAAAVVADASHALPLGSQVAALILSVFAPRNLPEFRRVLHPCGCLLVVTPGADHLASLRDPLGLLDIEANKDDRLCARASRDFILACEDHLTFELSLGHADALDLVSMGPSAHHLRADERKTRVARLPEPIPTRASFGLRLFQPRP